MNNGLLNSKKSILLVIDMQARLIESMEKPQELLKNVEKMIEGAGWMEVPVVYTEQVPEKLGPTHPDIAPLLKKSPKVEKSSFSVMGNEKFRAFAEKLKGKEVVIVGLEAHICVLQSVIDLIDLVKCKVYVVKDAVGSRHLGDFNAALARMEKHGAEIITVEMAFMEWLRGAEHQDFKTLQALIK